MNKAAIRKFAVWARTALKDGVSRRARQYGVTANGCGGASCCALTTEEEQQRKELFEQIQQKGYAQVMEEAAYSWFVRLAALRFMEVNGYVATCLLPHAQTEEQQRERLLTQCRGLIGVMPCIFAQAAYTELLLPRELVGGECILSRMATDIPEDDWRGQVQIIGWLHQFYHEKHKETVININKGVVKKEDIPAATQLFTTDWVVRYILDNSLGRYWIERHPQSRLKEKLPFLVIPENGRADTVNDPVCPKDIKVLDPCVGSGHFLVYAFDILLEIYRECGFSEQAAAQSIVQHNLYGLDIDERVLRLARFAVMMKARQYDADIFTREIAPHIHAVAASDGIDHTVIAYIANGDESLKTALQTLISDLRDADDHGSLARVTPVDFTALYRRLQTVREEDDSPYRSAALEQVLPLIQAGEALAKTYDVVVTNPPFLNKLDVKLKAFVTKHYKAYAGDLFSAFIYRGVRFCKPRGYAGYLSPFVWMFIKTYEKLRQYIIQNTTITTLVQMEYSAFEEATVPVCAFVLQNSSSTALGSYFKLSDFRGGMDVQRDRVLHALRNRACGYYYETDTARFAKIPGMPIAYWVSEHTADLFVTSKRIGDFTDARIGMVTGDNERFLRRWYEVSAEDIEHEATPLADPKRKTWYPLQKGGDFRLWYGNLEYVINWANDGYELKNDNYRGVCVRSHNYNGTQQFKEGITWNSVTSSKFSCRYCPTGFTFDAAGPLCEVTDRRHLLYILGMLSSKVADYYFSFINPTINFPSGYVECLPLPEQQNDRVDALVLENIALSKTDWDAFETSWDFKRHPLIPSGQSQSGVYIADMFGAWEAACTARFERLKANQEELNCYFIDVYGLQAELTPQVEDKDITVRKADVGREIRSLISYAVGCLLGRYSLDFEGIAFAGGAWKDTVYKTLLPVRDNILLVGEELTEQLVYFVEMVYGKGTLEENLRFIAAALGGAGAPRKVITTYLQRSFYADHVKLYHKRPIYWLFDAGRKHSFQALLYMHRYRPEQLSKMLSDYVSVRREAYDKLFADDRQKHRREKAEELHRFSQQLRLLAEKAIVIDPNDGIKHNYALFQEVTANIN